MQSTMLGTLRGVGHLFTKELNRMKAHSKAKIDRRFESYALNARSCCGSFASRQTHFDCRFDLFIRKSVDEVVMASYSRWVA